MLDKFLLCFLCIVIGVMMGYGWCYIVMHQAIKQIN